MQVCEADIFIFESLHNYFILLFYLSKINNTPAQPKRLCGGVVGKIAKIVDLNVSGDSTENGAPSAEDIEYVQVKFSDDETSQVFTLKQGASDSKVHYLKLSVTIKLDKRQSDYKDKKKLIESTMTTYLGSAVGDIVIEYTKEEASNSKKEMENRLLKALQAYYDTGAIYDVSFPEYVVS